MEMRGVLPKRLSQTSENDKKRTRLKRDKDAHIMEVLSIDRDNRLGLFKIVGSVICILLYINILQSALLRLQLLKVKIQNKALNLIAFRFLQNHHVV